MMLWSVLWWTTTTGFVHQHSGHSSVRLGASTDLFEKDPRPVVLYDGVCNLCNGAVNFVLDMDPEERLRFAALQSKAGRALLERSGRSPDDISSIVLVTKDEAYVKSAAVITIAQVLRHPLSFVARLAQLLIPTAIADWTYDLVAGNRYKILGRRDQCRLGDDAFLDRFILDLDDDDQPQ